MHNPPVYLTFHGIGIPPLRTPKTEIPYWMDEMVFADKIAEMAAAAKRLQLTLVATFDDGNRSDIEIAAHQLEIHKIAGLFFPCAGRLGQAGYLDASDLRMLKSFGFSIGSHGMHHLPWATLKREDLLRETIEAKAVIEAALGEKIDFAALPFGSYNKRVLAALRTAGFKKVFSSDPGLSGLDAWFCRRFSYRVDRDFNLDKMISRHNAISQKLISALKYQIKALR